MKNTKFKNTLGECLKNFWIDYTGMGRATRAEYWWCVFFYVVIVGTLISFSHFLVLGWTLFTMVPFVCLTARRLHDTNRSAWNILWFPEGILGFSVLLFILMFVLYLLKVDTSVMLHVYIGLFTPIFWVSLFASVFLMCLPGNKKANKYGKPRI